MGSCNRFIIENFRTLETAAAEGCQICWIVCRGLEAALYREDNTRHPVEDILEGNHISPLTRVTVCGSMHGEPATVGLSSARFEKEVSFELYNHSRMSTSPTPNIQSYDSLLR